MWGPVLGTGADSGDRDHNGDPHMNSVTGQMAETPTHASPHTMSTGMGNSAGTGVRPLTGTPNRAL